MRVVNTALSPSLSETDSGIYWIIREPLPDCKLGSDVDLSAQDILEPHRKWEARMRLYDKIAKACAILTFAGAFVIFPIMFAFNGVKAAMLPYPLYYVSICGTTSFLGGLITIFGLLGISMFSKAPIWTQEQMLAAQTAEERLQRENTQRQYANGLNRPLNNWNDRARGNDWIRRHFRDDISRTHVEDDEEFRRRNS